MSTRGLLRGVAPESGRANLDGSGINEQFLAGDSPQSVAADGFHVFNHVFWAGWGCQGYGAFGTDCFGLLSLADLTGALPAYGQWFLRERTAEPTGLAADAGYLYLGDDGGNIWRAPIGTFGPKHSFDVGLFKVLIHGQRSDRYATGRSHVDREQQSAWR